MGSLFSYMVWSGSSAGGLLPETGLGDLPESCVASVLVYLDPPQMCRMAMLNRAFRGASLADFVWESKLPLNYGDIIDKMFEKGDGFCNGLCKRDIYFRLCRPNTFDGGTKKVWLDKSTGKTCMLISSSGLAITGSMTGDIGAASQWKNQYSPRWHTSSKHGGSRSMGRSISHSRQALTVSFSDCSSAARTGGSAGVCVILNTSMAGIGNPSGSTSRLQTANGPPNSVT